MKRAVRRALLVLGLLAASTAEASAPPVPRVDHHQHLFSPATREVSPGIPVVTANNLVTFLDEAGIAQATVLSIAYQFGNPNRPVVADEYTRVRAENDWTRAQVERHPSRLRAFCSLNPLKPYALGEVRRCAADPVLRTGLKLHFGNSDVDVIADHDPVCGIFRIANAAGMALLIHARATFSRKRPYGAAQAEAFLRLLECAPDVPVTIAHLATGGNWRDPDIDAVLDVYARAIAARDPRVEKLWFDVSGVAGLGDWLSHRERIAAHLRAVGLDRVLFGSDGTPTLLRPRDAWAEFRRLPLSEAEFARVAANVAPWMH